jgi:hypothetical protein
LTPHSHFKNKSTSFRHHKRSRRYLYT